MQAPHAPQTGVRPPGWFTDPLDPAKIRFWNGDAWTQETAARIDMPPPAGDAHPAPPTTLATTPGPGKPPAAFPPAAYPASTHPASAYPGVHGNDPYAYGPYGYGDAGNYQTGDRGPSGKDGRSRRGRNGSGTVGLRANMFTSAAILLGILALIFMPLYVGVLAIASAAIAFMRAERRAATGLKVAIIGMVIGLALAYASAKFGLGI